MNLSALPGLGAIGGFEFYIQSLGGGNARELETVARRFAAG